ncbi:hypothetical protein ECG_03104 [Echinococcus granulosus]|uniref:Uncharacterized protein n=1 Tax=Echinococcus granulosus TaxID=6210 RepID=A0A068WJH6_ECHGR|nr:hypothetical protein ECG_03104 [Echinococcus granulosus]CDS19922.1 hypothetical protein EgrG_000210500 [Echinococcus granulosus]
MANSPPAEKSVVEMDGPSLGAKFAIYLACQSPRSTILMAQTFLFIPRVYLPFWMANPESALETTWGTTYPSYVSTIQLLHIAEHSFGDY